MFNDGTPSVFKSNTFFLNTTLTWDIFLTFTLFVCKCIEYISEDEILFLRKGVAKQICTNPQSVWCISVFSLY